MLFLALMWFQFIAAYQIDDAYIIYRYCDNLIQGNGFVYNLGERVEGVTCFLWTLFLTPFAMLPHLLPKITPYITATAGCCVLMLVPGISRRLRERNNADWLDWSASILLASHSSFAFWSFGSLETVPFTLLLVLAFRSYLLEAQVKKGLWSAIWVGLATLTRPKMILFLFAFIPNMFPYSKNNGRSLLLWSLIVVAFLLPLLLFRIYYFNDLLPNTYYAKAGASLTEKVHGGGLYSLNFFGSLIPAVGKNVVLTGLSGLLFILLVIFGLIRPHLRRLSLLLILIGFGTLVSGGDWMPLSRFWLPGLPFIYLLFVSALDCYICLPGKPIKYLYIIIVIFVFHNLSYGFQEYYKAGGISVYKNVEAINHQIAQTISQLAQSDDNIALMDIGQIGYETGLRITDISGLVTPWVAKSPGGFLNKQYPVEQLLEDKPRFVLLRPSFPIDYRVYTNPSFQINYRLIKNVELPRDRMLIFERHSG